MKFLSTRDLRNRPGFVRELAREDDIVLTANGKPIALLLGVEDDDFEETAQAIRQARAQRALSRMRRQAESQGLSHMSLSQINAEVRAVRSKRKVSSKKKAK
jgi:antitoxin (DNA-binding transcriptional repressor) of toxin-antitoxin stability system